MALIDDINALPSAPADGTTGHLKNHQVLHAAAKDHELRINSLSTRVPSSLALSKDTTYGDRFLIGGVTVAGSTPTVDITSLLSVPPNSGRLEVRRTATTIRYDFRTIEYSAGIVTHFSLPLGWHAGMNQRAELLDDNGRPLGALVATYDGNFTLRWDKAGPVRHTVEFGMQWLAAWPTGSPIQGA